MYYQGKKSLLERLGDWVFELGETKTIILSSVIGSIIGILFAYILLYTQLCTQ